MPPTEDLFVHLYVLAGDALIDKAVAISPRPGPVPACSHAEVLTIALVRHLPGRRPGCCRAAGSPAAPSPPGTAHPAPPWSWPLPAPSATSSARPSAARLP